MIKVTKQKSARLSDPVLQISLVILILNLGIAGILVWVGGLEGIINSLPAKMILFMACTMCLVIGLSFFSSQISIRHRIIWGVLAVLGVHETFYFVKWHSPSLQLLSVFLLLLGIYLERRMRKNI